MKGPPGSHDGPVRLAQALAPDMVERVARAICCPHGCRNADAVYVVCQAHTFRDDARAAIEAMREPTEAMVRASTAMVPTWDDDASRRKWAAMIDAALAVAPFGASPPSSERASSRDHAGPSEDA